MTIPFVDVWGINQDPPPWQGADTAVLAAANAYTDSTSGTGGGLPNTLRLEAQTGSTNDAKLDNAISTAALAANTPFISISTSQMTFNAGGHATFSGFKLIGSPQNGQQNMRSGGKSSPICITLNVESGTGAFLVTTGTVYDFYVANLAFKSGNGRGTVFDSAGGNVFGGRFTNLSFLGFYSVMGNEAGTPKNGAAIGDRKFLNTLCVLDGCWYTSTPNSCQYLFGGSDSEHWTFGEHNHGGDGAASTHVFYTIKYDNQIKTNVGPIYITAAKYMKALFVTGNAKGCHQLNFYGCKFEGQNGDVNPGYGNMVRKEGTGSCSFWGCWFAFGMTNLTLSDGLALFEIMGGTVNMYSPTQDRAAGQANTDTPLAYVLSGATLRIQWANRGEEDGGAGAWGSALPVVLAQAGSTVINDATITKTAV